MTSNADDRAVAASDKDMRIAILEDRIKYAIDLIHSSRVGEAVLELDRALHDPDMQPPFAQTTATDFCDDKPF